ncbi:MAG TPA: hypothetical protein VKU92_08540 [Acidimicrobiales bacterium]|nr:hypothetical protein [Acidimicrobiales bacterium]
MLDLVQLLPETAVVAYPNDSAMHSEMVWFAAERLAAGHLPLNGWFPFLNVGSPQFLHYQSLPAMLTGAVGLALGPYRAFAWSTYLLLATWPLSVYLSARLFRLGRWAASAAAVMSPFLVSAPGLGYEQSSYLWIGYGLWTQLWAMWSLPLAWGLTWRAIDEGRYRFAACVAIVATMAFHYETGYLAVLPILLFLLVRPRPFAPRLRRAAIVLGGSMLGGSWIVVPLLAMRNYAAINEFLQHTSHADSFGARRVLSWLAEGQLFDHDRFPVVTACLAVGLVAAAARCRRDAVARALLALFASSLVLFFGRPTLGPLLVLLPGSKDLFLRRFVIGVQLAGLLIAGSGAAALAGAARSAGLRAKGWLRRQLDRPLAPLVTRALAATAFGAAMAPAVWQLHKYDNFNRRDIAVQAHADATEGRQVETLVARLERMGPGRVYAGLPYENWGENFLVGYVPVLQYLARLHADEIGFTLRTASLMSNPEAYFDEYEPGDYSMFGVRYLILPASRAPSVPAVEVMRRAGYTLWRVPGTSYVTLVQTEGTIRLGPSDIGRATSAFLDSSLPGSGIYPTVAYSSHAAATPILPGATGSLLPAGSPGRVLAERADLQAGRLSALVRAERDAVVLASASYDPGWKATVDGHAVPVEMIAPALVGVRVGPGLHEVRFSFEGFGWYPELAATSGVSLGSVALLDLAGRRRRRRASSEQPRGASRATTAPSPDWISSTPR